MKIELRYFTGTGNAWKVLDTCREVFSGAGHQVNITTIDPKEHELDADLIGFSFPIYAFGMPRIVLRYLKSLKPFPKQQKVFFICTPAEVIGAANTTNVCERLLKRKNCKVVSSDVLNMPNNWIPFSKTDSPEINREIIDNSISKATKMAEEILNEKASLFNIKQIPYFLRLLGHFNFMFRFPGLFSMKLLFNTYATCNGCGICAKACPTGSIRIIKGKPRWSRTCEQCMRCVHVCPQKSIYQFPSSTKGKDRYIEPDFKPLNNERKV